MPDLIPLEDSSAEHLRLVIGGGHVGIWELDLQTGRAVRNKTHDEIFGYDTHLADWSYDVFMDHVVGDDRARVDALQKEAVENDSTWSFECVTAPFEP